NRIGPCARGDGAAGDRYPRRVGRDQRWAAPSVALVVMVLGLVSCGQDEAVAPETEVFNGTPAVAEALHGPGTPLGDGFVVPEGASLVGAALPNRPEIVYTAEGTVGISARRTWTALLAVA